MESNYIYLLKEREFIMLNQDIYKVGMTKKANHQRFHQYPKGSILLFQMICSDCNYYEKKVIALFKEEFILRKDIGNEYFEGDYVLMIDYIYATLRHLPITTNLPVSIKKEIDPMLITFQLVDDKYYCQLFHTQEIIMILSDVVDDNELNYFINLLSDEIISLNTPFDINDQHLVKMLLLKKVSLHIEHYDIFAKHFNIEEEKEEEEIKKKIMGLFCLNVVINETIFATINDHIYKYVHQLNDFDSFNVDIGRYVCHECKSQYVTLYHIHSKFYNYETFLLPYMPYEIRWDKDHHYYHLNRRNEIINGVDVSGYQWIGSHRLFNESNKPWECKKKYVRFLKEYHRIIEEKLLYTCLNREQSILSLLY